VGRSGARSAAGEELECLPGYTETDLEGQPNSQE
jgi:hypothetical protein